MKLPKVIYILAFGVTEDKMEKVAAMLGRNKKTEKLGNS